MHSSRTTRIEIAGVTAHVRFVCRYRDENEYAIGIRGSADLRVTLFDDGRISCGLSPVPAETIRAILREYERGVWSDFVAWCAANGYDNQFSPHAIAA